MTRLRAFQQRIVTRSVPVRDPDLGVFRADCDAYGRAVFSGDEVDQMVSETGGDRVALGT